MWSKLSVGDTLYEEYERDQWFEIQSKGVSLALGLSWGLFTLECFLYFSYPQIPLAKLVGLHLLHTALQFWVSRTVRSAVLEAKPLVCSNFLATAAIAGVVSGYLDACLPFLFFWTLGLFVSAGFGMYPQKPLPALFSSAFVNGVFLISYLYVHSLQELPILALAVYFSMGTVITTFAASLYHRLLHREFEARRKTEQERESHFRTLQSIGDGIVSLDKDGRVQFCNREAEKMLGLFWRDVLGKPYNEVIARIPLVELGATPVERKVEDDLGRESWVSVRVQPGEEGSLVTLQDITMRKEAERSRLVASKMESLSFLAGGIAHNFNNLLTVIQGQVSLLREDLSGDLARLESLELVQKATDDAAELAKYLLTFSPGGVPVLESVSLPGFVESSLQLALSGSDITPEVDFEKDLDPVFVDREQFDQVLRNLIVNAIEAMPGGGRLMVRASNYRSDGTVSNLPKGRFVRFCLQDTGPGIDPSIQSKIFDPYFSTKPGGNGLGLTTSYSVVARHGGTLEVKSVQPRGTCVTIYLPVSARQASPTPSVEKPSNLGGGRILVMDDEASVRQVLARMLKHLGFEATQTACGEDAVQEYRNALATRPFRCVLLDLVVPRGMGGKETLKQLRKLDPEVIAIVASGYANEPVIARFDSYGFKARLPKPFGLTQLEEALGTAWGGTTVKKLRPRGRRCRCCRPLVAG